tara:strand:- start:2444 stop:2713 length:270 start_codon:yes stop_codon:yes gene_type:complete
MENPIKKKLTKAQIFRKESKGGIKIKMSKDELYKSNLDANKRFYERNRDRLKSQKLEYYHANREKILERNRERRLKKKAEKNAQKLSSQ